MKFTLEIDSDNVGMETVEDLRANLLDIAAKVVEGDFHPGHTRSIMDRNGNRVGSWKVYP